MFALRNNKGFSIEFANGIAVSVIFGYGSYSDNRYLRTDSLDNSGDSWQGMQSNNAEVAVMVKDGGWLTQECFDELFGEDIGDDVAGHRSPKEIAQVIAWAEGQRRVL